MRADRRRVLIALGTRPEAIKLAPVIRSLRAVPDEVEVTVCSTGQHRELLSQALSTFGLTADIDLNVMRTSQDLNQLLARILEGMGNVLDRLDPDAVLVQGDTTTALGCSLAAFHRAVPVGHVEAGLRTYNPASPFPEEINRQLVSRIATWNFAPTESNLRTLLAEGCRPSGIAVTGNTVVDGLEWMLQQLERDSALKLAAIDGLNAILHFPWRERRYLVVTGHRRESFGEGLQNICMALVDIAQAHPELHIIYPVHPNPSVQEATRRVLSHESNIHLCPPVDYAQMVLLLNSALFIISDSGGIQEEAPTLHKPVLLTRNETERTEGVEAGCARVVGTSRSSLASSINELLCDPSALEAMAQVPNPYGDGHASERIRDILLRSWRQQSRSSLS